MEVSINIIADKNLQEKVEECCRVFIEPFLPYVTDKNYTETYKDISKPAIRLVHLQFVLSIVTDIWHFICCLRRI